nr:hypothetical protein [Tanacetum cinerariifolium]
MGTSSGLKTWCLAQCGVKNRSNMTNMLFGESLIGGTNVNTSTNLQSTRSLLEMSTQNVESSLSPNFRLSNGIITSIWIGSRKVDKSDGQRTLCFQRLSKNVHKKHRHLTACGRSSTGYLQLGVKSYQKKLNLTKPDTYRFDLKHKESYTAYSNPRGFIYQNKDKQNRLMRIDELHKFSDGTLNDVRTALDDHLKVIRMKYLPQFIWRKSDKERAATMIQAIDKQLKTKRIMQNGEVCCDKVFKLNNFKKDSYKSYQVIKSGKKEEYETWAMKMEYWIMNTDHMGDFHHLDDARENWLAVKARFGGLHKGYDRFQKILSQLNQMQEKPDNDDVNMMFLRALPPSWSQVALTLKTRGGLEYLSFDDLYNKLRSLEIVIKGGSSYGSRDFEHVDQMEMEELDIKWQMAMLSLRINMFQKKAGRKINFNNKDTARFDRRKARCYNCLQLGHFVRECNVKKVDEKARYFAFKILEVKTEEPQAMVFVDSMLNWNEHEAENKTEEGEQVYGLMARFKSDFADHASNAAGSVYDATTEFAMIGISPKVQTYLFGCDSQLSERKKNYDHLEKLYNDSFIQVQAYKNTVKTLELQKDWYHKTQLALEEKVKILSANLENTTNTLKYSETFYDQAKIEKKKWEVKLVESLARFDKWTKSSKNLGKLINRSMSTRTKLGLRFKECIGSDEVFNLSIPSVFDPEPENREVKHLYESPKTNDSFFTVDVKILPMSDVKDPSPTNGFPSCSFKENVKPLRNLCNKSRITDRIHYKNNFVHTKTCFVYGSKSHLIKDCDAYDNVENFPSVVSNATSVPVGSRNSLASISACRSILAASRNRPVSIHAGRHIPAGRFNKPAPFPAGRSVPTGWTNHAARPFLRPTNLYFDNVHPHVNKDICIVDSALLKTRACTRIEGRNKPKGRLTIVYFVYTNFCAENKTEEGEQVYGLMAGFKSNFADHAGNAASSVYDAVAEFAMMEISPKAKIENKEWEVKLVDSLARFNKWKESSKNLAKLINSFMSTRTKLGLGFKEYIRSDDVFDLSTPSVFDPEPENREVKSLYESDKSSESETYNFASCVSSPKTNDSLSTVDVKILPKSDVKDPSPTNGFHICSFKKNVKPLRNLCNKSGIADRIHCKNNFVCTKTCFVCGSKSHLIKDCDMYDNVDNFPSVVSKATSVPAGSRNSLASISAGRSILAASRNRPASIHAGRYIPTGRFNKPAPFPAGRSAPTGWTNHAARPYFRPTTLYFDNVSWPGIYDHMSMNEGRWGSAVKSSASCS